jgi:hypothetical protein
MSKIKMRCINCGKWFQAANAKEVTCPDCVQKARKEKMAAKSAPPTSNKTAGQGVNAPTRPVPAPPPKPATASGTSHWLDTLSDVKVGAPDQPTRPKIPSSPVPREQRGEPERPGSRGPGDQRDEHGPGAYREGGSRGSGGYREREREGRYHGPAAYRVGDMTGTLGQRPRQPMEGGRGPRPGAPGEPRPERRFPGGRQGGKPGKPKAAKPAAPPKPKREKIPPPEPFKPTPEQVAQVEARYLELAIPTEFDGIRTQISKELNIPKKAVKQIVKELRDRQDIPSWWDLQTYKGDSEELAKIRALYEPRLPLPDIGIHKKIAEELSIQPGTVYQAIKLIRQEMNLPQYNDPTLHGLDPESVKKRKKEQTEEKAEVGEDGAKPDEMTAKAESHVEGEIAAVVSEVAGDKTEAAVTDGKADSGSEGEASPVVVEPVVKAQGDAQAAETGEIASTVAANSDGVAEG